MPIDVKKRENESSNSMLYRFNKRVQHSGVIKEVRKRQFKKRVENKTKLRAGAAYRRERAAELQAAKKKGK